MRHHRKPSPRRCRRRGRPGPAPAAAARRRLERHRHARAAASRSPTSSRSRSSATPEGKVSVLAWPGYVEDGRTTPGRLGARRSRRRPAARSPSRPSAPPTRPCSSCAPAQYDVVSASGDATLRLIAAGDVEPVNTDLVTNYADIFDVPEGPAVELASTARCTASRTAAAPTC